MIDRANRGEDGCRRWGFRALDSPGVCRQFTYVVFKMLSLRQDRVSATLRRTRLTSIMTKQLTSFHAYWPEREMISSPNREAISFLYHGYSKGLN